MLSAAAPQRLADSEHSADATTSPTTSASVKQKSPLSVQTQWSLNSLRIPPATSYPWMASGPPSPSLLMHACNVPSAPAAAAPHAYFPQNTVISPSTTPQMPPSSPIVGSPRRPFVSSPTAAQGSRVDLSSAFGDGLFSPSWQSHPNLNYSNPASVKTTSTVGGVAASSSNVPSTVATSSGKQNEPLNSNNRPTVASDESNLDLQRMRFSIERTLDYLGLDDDEQNGQQRRKKSVLLSGEMQQSTSQESNRLQTTSTYRAIPSRSLWIGNVDASLTESDIRSTFSSFGEIESIRMLPEKECAFVNYVRLADAKSAFDAMQGSHLGSCIIRIGYGRDSAASTTTSAFISSDGLVPSRALWIGNLSASVSVQDLYAMFESFGPIESCRSLPQKSCGFVNFVRIEDAANAKEKTQGLVVDGVAIKVGFAKAPEDERPEAAYKSSVDVSSSSIAIHAPKVSTDSFLPQQQQGLSPLPKDDAYPQTTSPENVDYVDLIHTLPHTTGTVDSTLNSNIDGVQLREIRKKLEHSHPSAREMELILQELMPYLIELATDAFGNTVVQRMIERASDIQRQRIMEVCLPVLPAISIHKNGTWVVQKIVEYAKLPQQVLQIVNALKAYTPALLMDPFGNYVIQGCLRLGARNQFIFDALQERCLELGQAKFGARAMRACLESPHATRQQHMQVANAVIQHAPVLISNPNGILLLHWLVDNSHLDGRYMIMIQRLLHRLPLLCNQKLAFVVLIKVLNQQLEVDARELFVMQGLFKSQDTLEQTLFAGSVTSIGADVVKIPTELGSHMLSKCLQRWGDERPDQLHTLKQMLKHTLDQGGWIVPRNTAARDAFERLQMIIHE